MSQPQRQGDDPAAPLCDEEEDDVMMAVKVHTASRVEIFIVNAVWIHIALGVFLLYIFLLLGPRELCPDGFMQSAKFVCPNNHVIKLRSPHCPDGEEAIEMYRCDPLSALPEPRETEFYIMCIFHVVYIAVAYLLLPKYFI